MKEKKNREERRERKEKKEESRKKKETNIENKGQFTCEDEDQHSRNYTMPQKR